VSRRPVVGRCPGERAKTAYRNRHAARTAIERINAAKRAQGQPVTRLFAYRCRHPRCGAFHLTHLHPDEFWGQFDDFDDDPAHPAA